MFTSWLPLIDTLLMIMGTVLTAFVGWLIARQFNHSNRISKLEASLRPILEAIEKLDRRAGKQEDAHLEVTKAIGEVNAQLATLDERTSNTTTTLNRIDTRLEQLFAPKAEARARANRAQA